MAKLIGELRPVYVVGIGWHRYQYATENSYIELGVTAIRQALADAGIEWEAVESSYVATARLGMAPGRPMLGKLGNKGAPLVHIDNASASGSAAFRAACIEVASGISDCVLAVGVDKPQKGGPTYRAPSGIPDLAGDAILPFTHFALLTNGYVHKHKVDADDIALIAVKNHNNGALNPNAQRQQSRTLEEVVSGRKIAGTLTALQCTPVGEGGAAVIVCSEDGIKSLGINAGRAVRVASSVGASEGFGDALNVDSSLSSLTMNRAIAQAGIKPADLDIIELHDAFTIEEALYAEASGVCESGEFVPLLKEGAFDIGGRCAISPSGGLIAMGHPLGPTGIGQVAEIALQLRGEAGARQQPNARHGLAHMVGIGSVSYVHVLAK